VSREPEQLDVFWVAPDGAIRSHWWRQGFPNGAWAEHEPFNIAPPGSAQPGTAVAAVSREPEQLDVFWVAPDGAIRSHWWRQGFPNGAWAEHEPFNIAPPGSAG
jgi:hypothetical protein